MRCAPASPGGTDESGAKSGSEGGPVRVRGLRRTVDLIVRRVAMEASGNGYGLEPLHRSIVTERRALESELRQRGVAAEQLTDEARGVRGWLGWMAGGDLETTGAGNTGSADGSPSGSPSAPAVWPAPDERAELIDGASTADSAPHPLKATVTAVQYVTEAIDRRLNTSDALLRHLTGRRRLEANLLVSDRRARVDVSFRPMRAVTRAEVRDGAVRLWIQAPLATIGRDGLDAVVAMMAGEAEARQVVHESMLSGAFQSALAAIEAMGGTVARTQGTVHDLDTSFARVNEHFFGGAMDRPTISWSRAETRRMFGHYEFVSDALVVSSSLDRADVPEFVVDFIIYHELLHKKHGLRWSGTRAHAHTAAFRSDERKFPGLPEAERVLRRIAAGR